MRVFLNKILNNVYIWNFFRKFIDCFFGIYRRRKSAIKQAGLTDKMSLIDIGCGTGQYSTLTNGKYLGVDLNENYINYARKIYGKENKEFACADINNLDLPEASYDAALLIDVIHHLTDEENRRLLKTLNRLATQLVIICDPIKQNKLNFIGRFLTYLDRGKYIRPKQKLLDLISENLQIKKVIDLKMMGVSNVCVICQRKSG